MTAPLLHFPRDVALRQRLFDPRSFQHDARANLGLLDYLIRNYTRPGDLVLDPMGGTGSLFLGLAVGGRRVVCGELEAWLRRILESNRRRAAAWAPASGLAYQGDATKLPLASGSVDAIITSPPYADTFSDWHISSNRLKRGNNQGPYGSAYGDDRGRQVKHNIGNLHIYEDYLAAMHLAFREYARVLKAHGTLALIVKDKIKGGQRVPIVRDLTTVLRALSFVIDDTLSRDTQLSQYRQLHKAQGRPVIEDEQIIIARKHWARWPGRDEAWAIVMVPEASGPPSLVYQKALAHARATAEWVMCFVPGKGLFWPTLGEAPLRALDVLARAKYTLRVAAAYRVCEELVHDNGLRAGNHVSLHVPWRYAQYLAKRLTTLGAVVSVPTRGLNMGQKLAYYTDSPRLDLA